MQLLQCFGRKDSNSKRRKCSRKLGRDKGYTYTQMERGSPRFRESPAPEMSLSDPFVIKPALANGEQAPFSSIKPLLSLKTAWPQSAMPGVISSTSDTFINIKIMKIYVSIRNQREAHLNRIYSFNSHGWNMKLVVLMSNKTRELYIRISFLLKSRCFKLNLISAKLVTK